MKVFIQIEDSAKFNEFYEKMKEFAKICNKQFDKQKKKLEKIGVVLPEILHVVYKDKERENVVVIENSLDLGLGNWFLRRAVSKNLRKAIEEYLKENKIEGKIIKIV